MDTPASGTSPTYRDGQLGALLKELRAAVKGTRAEAILKRVEARLRWALRIIESWDAHHAERAETLIRLGQFEAANSTASMIFDDKVRGDLYWRAPVSIDRGASDRVAEALEMEREVLA